jgi:hypothetical protein
MDFKTLNTDLTLYKISRTKNLKQNLKSYNSSLTNDLKIIYEYETYNIKDVGKCINSQMKHAQYRKYEQVYQIDINIIIQFIKQCDNNINLVKKYINNNIQIGDEQLYMYIPILLKIAICRRH